MANLNVSNVGQTGLNWDISALSSAWNTTNYVSAVIATSPVSNGQSAAPTGVLGSQSPPSSGTNTFTPTVGLSVTPDTHYGLFGCVQTPAASQWFQAGSSTFWTYPQSPSSLTGLVATGRDTYVHLTWNASANANGYNISWSGGSSGSTSVGNTTVSDITGLINGSSYTFTVTPSNLSANSGLTSTGGSGSASAIPNKTRPSNFSFVYSTISSGSNAIVDNRDWNALTSRINDFRAYKSVGTISFTAVSSSMGAITASLFNELVNGANGVAAYMTNNLMPTTKSTGNDFYASYLTNIVTSINSIT